MDREERLHWLFMVRFVAPNFLPKKSKTALLSFFAENRLKTIKINFNINKK
jgi:hypothetical protein